MRFAFLTTAMILVVAAPAAGQTGPQPVRLADGDSFALGSVRYRLYGIDAPELHQTCADAQGRDWPCGTRARSELRRIIGTSPVQCRTLSSDRYGRSVAVCHVAGRDLSEEMVRTGFAIAIERRGQHNPYKYAETQARATKVGLWAGRFEKPGDWRRHNPRDPETDQALEAPRDWLVRKSIELWQALIAWVTSVLRA